MRTKYRALPSQAQLKALMHYDPETGKFTRAQTKRRWKQGQVMGAVANGYINLNLDGRLYRAHRVAWVYMTGEDPEAGIDHVNGVGTDNRWANLRAADQSNNLCNRGAQTNSATGVKGVYKTGGKYVARVHYRKKRHYIGFYSTIEEAKAAYDAAAKVIHGIFFKP